MKYDKTNFAVRFVGFYVITLFFVWTTKSLSYLVLYGLFISVGLYILQKVKHLDSMYTNPFWFLTGAVIAVSPFASILAVKMGVFTLLSSFAFLLFSDIEKV